MDKMSTALLEQIQKMALEPNGMSQMDINRLQFAAQAALLEQLGDLTSKVNTIAERQIVIQNAQVSCQAGTCSKMNGVPDLVWDVLSRPKVMMGMLLLYTCILTSDIRQPIMKSLGIPIFGSDHSKSDQLDTSPSPRLQNKP